MSERDESPAVNESTDRRGFLKRTAAAGLAAAIPGIPGPEPEFVSPDRLLPEQQQGPFAAPPMSKVRIGFVGVGGMGSVHVDNLLRIPGAEIVAICDIVESTRLAERFPRNGDALVEHAADFLGLPYLWGGTSEKGFDCSGLVQRIYGLHGIRLPRDAHPQSRVGEPVKPGSGWRDVRPGDLAFFEEPPGGRVTHVGILARGGRMIHASTTQNGVAWDVLPPAGASTPLGERLAGWLSGIRRVLSD